MNKDSFLSSYLPVSKDFRSKKYPFYWVARLNSLYSAEMDRFLKPLGLNSSKWRVLMILKEYGQLSMTEISTHTVAKLSTITKTIYRMQDDGLVKTSYSLVDGRVTEVVLTKAGLEKLELAKQATSRLIEKAFNGFTEEEISYTNKCLEKIFKNINES